MTDSLSKAERSWNMSLVRSKDTRPEILVRSLLHRAGFRFRIHKTELPGKPDIVLAKYKTVIFVHGCFWHNHTGCSDATTPKTRTAFWKKKFKENIARDQRAITNIKNLGWNVIIVWECELKKTEKLLKGLKHEIRKSLNKKKYTDKK